MDRADIVQIACTALTDTLNFLLPVSCAGCDEPDAGLCEACRCALTPRVRERMLEAPGGAIPVWSGLAFEDETARVIRALKEQGRTGLARPLAPALAAAVASLHARGAVLVPMPTSRAAYRRRGYRVPELLAARAGLDVARLLRPARLTHDQRGLGRSERRRNVEHSLRAADAAGRRVVVIDDVVTTGASLAEAVRALRAAGAEVMGAATAAATPRRMNDGGRDGVSIETHR